MHFLTSPSSYPVKIRGSSSSSFSSFLLSFRGPRNGPPTTQERSRLHPVPPTGGGRCRWSGDQLDHLSRRRRPARVGRFFWGWLGGDQVRRKSCRRFRLLGRIQGGVWTLGGVVLKQHIDKTTFSYIYIETSLPPIGLFCASWFGCCNWSLIFRTMAEQAATATYLFFAQVL